MIDGVDKQKHCELIYQTALEFKIEYLFESIRETENFNI